MLCANGEVTKLTCLFGHDNKIRHKVGDVINQGENLCAEGTSGNATGNHCHLEVGIGSFVGTWYPNQYGIYMLYNAVKPNEYLSLPDNYEVIDDGGYNWVRTSNVKEPSVNLTLYLPRSAKTWRVYPMGVPPVIGNECGKLLPSKFGGLTYDIEEFTMPDVAVIQTRDFGKVQIYVTKSTGAIIK